MGKRKLRPCAIRNPAGAGWFHGWGVDSDADGKGGGGNFTVAIVEHLNGTVRSYALSCGFRFTDREESDG